MAVVKISEYLKPNRIYHGDARALLKRIEPETVALSLWSPPYFVGKEYEKELTFEDWKSLLNETIHLHHEILKPGGFLAINVADILCFKDESMPKIMAENVSRRKINRIRSGGWRFVASQDYFLAPKGMVLYLRVS